MDGVLIRKKVNISRLKLYTRRETDGRKRKGRKGEDERKPAPKKHCGDNLVREIVAGDELGDEHISFATSLLQEQFPTLDGFQPAVLGQIDGFRPVRSDCDSIQIHHTGKFHWVTSSKSTNCITVYDSKFGGTPLSSSLQVQLALIYKTSIKATGDKKSLAVEFPGVQQQLESKDCGVFAIAFAYHAGIVF